MKTQQNGFNFPPRWQLIIMCIVVTNKFKKLKKNNKSVQLSPTQVKTPM